MDFYRLFSVHIRAWTPLEIICFLMAAAGTGIVLVRAVRCHRMKISQAISAFAFFVFLSLVFASTVFTRSVGTRQCELIPLWSWAEVIFVYYGENVPLFRRNGYQKSGAMIP